MGLKNKIKAAVKADEMIEKCQVCSERKKQIVAHHPTVKNPATALITIFKCNQCRPILFAIRQCATEGHIIIKDTEPNKTILPHKHKYTEDGFCEICQRHHTDIRLQELEEAYYEKQERESKTPQCAQEGHIITEEKP